MHNPKTSHNAQAANNIKNIQNLAYVPNHCSGASPYGFLAHVNRVYIAPRGGPFSLVNVDRRFRCAKFTGEERAWKLSRRNGRLFSSCRVASFFDVTDWVGA